MARPPKPWFWKARQCWYVNLQGQRIQLAPDKAQALKLFHELMLRPADPAPVSDAAIAALDRYLEWVQLHRSRTTYKWYLGFLQSLADTLPRQLRLKDLKPWHVQQWVDQGADHSASTRRAKITAAKRALRWAEEQGYIDRSPLANLSKPACGRREVVITPDQFTEILAAIRDECFRDLLIAAWDTGARPQELTALEARHFDAVNARWVFPIQESKNKKRPRIIYLTERIEALTRRRIAEQGPGAVFRNRQGMPWTKDSVGCRFQRLTAKIGTLYCLYHFRHSFATRKMQEGLDPLTVAELLGHSDPSMLAKVYQHLSHDPQHMLNKLRTAGQS